MKVYKSFKVAGINYYDALFVIEKMKVGDKVKFKLEDNIYDENAVEVYYKGKKLGYIPRNANYSIATILKAGWKIFKGYIQNIDKETFEIQIAVFVKEK